MNEMCDVGFPFFPDFQFLGKRKICLKNLKISRDPENPWDSRDSENSRENFPGFGKSPKNIFYDFQHFRSNF